MYTLENRFCSVVLFSNVVCDCQDVTQLPSLQHGGSENIESEPH